MVVIYVSCLLIGREYQCYFNLQCISPERKVKWYNEYFSNEHVFHTKEYGQGKMTYNNRVCVKGSTSKNVLNITWKSIITHAKYMS
jgi:hypothetical protein